jgi:thymidine kinase
VEAASEGEKEMIDIKELRRIAREDAEDTINYSFGEPMVAVSSEYLLEIADELDELRAACEGKKK